jgi:anti-sigma B factor antagonist
MSFDVKLIGRVLHVSLQDAIDLSVTPTLKEHFSQLMSSDVNEVRVDAGGLTYIDSSGVASLLFLRKLATRFNSNFLMLTISDAAARVIQLANLDTVLGVITASRVSPAGQSAGAAANDAFQFSDADAMNLFQDGPSVTK